MKVLWKRITDKSSDEDRIHNLALFEIFMTIINNKADCSIKEEVQALCAFAMGCMYPDMQDKHEFDKILFKKDKEIEKIVSNVSDIPSITGGMAGEA